MMLKRILMAVTLMLVSPVIASEKAAPKLLPVLHVGGETLLGGVVIASTLYTGASALEIRTPGKTHAELVAEQQSEFVKAYVGMCRSQVNNSAFSESEFQSCVDKIYSRNYQDLLKILGGRKV